MQQQAYISRFLPMACQAGETFRINPVVILAQSAIESGWGESILSREHHNFFGITAYSRRNPWWDGTSIQLSAHSLSFRAYPSPESGFMDYARLIRSAYPAAANSSFTPVAFAQAIAYSKYISEVNGDNREAYRQLLIRVCREVERLKDS